MASMSVIGAGGHSEGFRELRISANLTCGGGACELTPELWGSASLREMIPVNEGGARGREPSAKGK